MLDYSFEIRNYDKKTALIQTGQVTQAGKITFDVPKDIPNGSTIIIEWKPSAGSEFCKCSH